SRRGSRGTRGTGTWTGARGGRHGASAHGATARSERRVGVPAGTAIDFVRMVLDGVVDRVLLAPDAIHLAAALHLVHRAEPLEVLPRLRHGGSDAGRGEVWARRDVHRGQRWRPDRPGGGAVGFSDRVDAPGGLEVVVPPVQSVEVVEAGGASPCGVRVVELLDVVVLRVIAGAPGASGDGAAGSGEPQVLDHLGGGPVARGGELGELTGGRGGEA